MSALTIKCRHLLRPTFAVSSPACSRTGYFREHPHDVPLSVANLGLDLFERTRRLIAVKIAVEVDLVADQPDFAVLRIALFGVDPGIRHVRLHLAREESLDALRE